MIPPVGPSANGSAVAAVSFSSVSQAPSSVHAALQQSPLVRLPSSHCSLPATMPSLQNVAQMLGAVPVHVQPLSTTQTPLQPSPAAEFPSSQPSVPARTPSPHVVAQALGMPVQVQPASTSHALEQPSSESASW